MFNWYRASPMTVPAMDEEASPPPFLDAPFPKLHIPVLIVWGLDDKALLPCLLEGLDDIGRTQQFQSQIDAFRARYKQELPFQATPTAG